jgi:hypothetical protein
MRGLKSSLALGAVVAALSAASLIDSALAAEAPPSGDAKPTLPPVLSTTLTRAPQPSQSLPGATSRPVNRGMRGAPSMGGRGMPGMGGGRMNGGMGRR